MKIIKFTAENIKRLKAVSITPTGNVVEVTGQNGHGKSSVLDAIYYALAGQSVIPPGVVREGEEKALIKLDLGSLIVTRKFTGETTSLVVESLEGARFTSPQTMLDQLVGSLSFDPLKFSRMRPEDQHLELQRLVPELSKELVKIENNMSELAASRRDATRDVKRLEAQVVGLEIRDPESIPDEPVDVTKLVEQINMINQKNGEIRDRKQRLVDEKRKIQDKHGRAEELRKDAERLREEAKVILEKAGNFDIRANYYDSEAISDAEALDVSVETEEPCSTDEVVGQIRRARDVNKLVDQKQRLRDLQSQLSAADAILKNHQRDIELLDDERHRLIAGATMPVEGLMLSEGKVLYQGRDLALASDAEKLRVSVAIAMATNPKLRVLRIKDGSLLDESSLTLLSSLAETNDYQVWIERVEDSHGRPCVIMEDGQVKNLADVAQVVEAARDFEIPYVAKDEDKYSYGDVGSVPGDA